MSDDEKEIRKIMASHYRIGKSSKTAPVRWVCSCKAEFACLLDHDQHRINEQVKAFIARFGLAAVSRAGS